MPHLSRTIFHVDMDAFFVSVEELFDPSLKGKPVIVGGQRHERGVVSAASYAARKFGVHSAMPLRTAARLCPQAIFVDGHPDRYRDCSRKVHAILKTFSPLVDMASIDEAYMDLTATERLHGPPLSAAHALHDIGIRKVGDLAALDESFLEQRFGKWGLALAGKSRGLDAGGWYSGEVGDDRGPKSISHEHTFNEDTADDGTLEATLARLS